MLLMLLPGSVTAAGDEPKAFRFLPSGPLMPAAVSDSYSTLNRLELQWANQAPPGYPFAEGYTRRPLVDIRLGIDVPVMGGEIERWSWYFGLPISMELLNDFFQPETAPVVNVDYMFGIRADVLYDLNIRWPGNIGLRILPIFHESTHLGDEVSLFWSQNDSDYYRINVSYEAWDIALCLDEWDGGQTAAFTLRLGLSGRWNRDGYYPLPKDEEYGDPSDTFYSSRGRMEYYGQFHATVPSGFPALGNWVFRGGLEVRNRILFDYFSDDPETRAWTVTGSVAWHRFPDSWGGRSIGFHLRILGGQNPHGQYREQYGYLTVGAGLSMGL